MPLTWQGFDNRRIVVVPTVLWLRQLVEGFGHDQLDDPWYQYEVFQVNGHGDL